MQWLLKVQTDRGFSDVACLSAGEGIVLGRTEAADLPFPHDDLMSGRHVQLKAVESELCFDDLQSTNGTFLNGSQAVSGILKPGDSLMCGNTVFFVEVSDGAGKPPKVSGTAVKTTASSTAAPSHRHAPQSKSDEEIPTDCLQAEGFIAPLASEIATRFELAKTLSIKPFEGEGCDSFAKRCLTEGADNDVIDFLARALPRRLGVWWALGCIESANAITQESDTALVQKISGWVMQPSETLRREIMSLAQSTEMNTAAAWAGVAVFWSHGSMAPPNAPAVPPTPDLPGRAISGAVILASVAKAPEKAPEKRRSFAELALMNAGGKKLWS